MPRKRPRRTPARSRASRWLRRFALGVVAAAVVATALPIGWLTVREPPTTAFMLRSRFADPATGRACEVVRHRFVGREAIAPALRRAVVLAEDQRFLEHHGFDFRQLRRAVEERGQGSRLRGASTLTQQLAKNLFLWPGRSVVRKALEAWYTVWLEVGLPKQRILELYLNVAQFGPCVFGVEAAARRHFGVRAANVTPEQAALLAAALPSPAKIRAGDPGPYARERAREILALMDATRGAAWLRGI